MQTKVVAKVVVVDERRNVLLLRRSQTDTRRPGQWDFPGGNAEAGESYVTACAREAEEEAGLKILPEQLQIFRAESRVIDANATPMNIIWLFYFVQLQNQPEIALSFEHDRSTWMSLDDAIEDLNYDVHIETLRYLRDNKLLEQ